MPSLSPTQRTRLKAQFQTIIRQIEEMDKNLDDSPISVTESRIISARGRLDFAQAILLKTE